MYYESIFLASTIVNIYTVITVLSKFLLVVQLFINVVKPTKTEFQGTVK